MKKIILGILFGALFLLPGLLVKAETSDKALQADASIKANLSALRAHAEIFYDNVYIANNSGGYYGGSYKNMCEDSTIKEILNKIKKDSGKSLKCNSAKDNYAISSSLKSDRSVQYCVDSTGFYGSGVAVSKNNMNVCEKQAEKTTTVKIDSKAQKAKILKILKDLKQDGVISFDDRVQLETGIRSLGDEAIVKQWNIFIASLDKETAQKNKDILISMLSGKKVSATKKEDSKTNTTTKKDNFIGEKIKVIKPSSGTKIKEENDITINWKEYKGEFDHYRISLRNKLAPDLITSGQVVPKENKEFTFDGESLTSHHVEFWRLNSGGVLLNKLRKNFYFEIVAINKSMQPVATGYSKTFSIIENKNVNNVATKRLVKNYATYTDVTGSYTVTYPSNWKFYNKNDYVEYGDFVTQFSMSGELYTETDLLYIVLISRDMFDKESKKLIMRSSVKFGENIFKEFNEEKPGAGWDMKRKNFVLELEDSGVLIFNTYDLSPELEKVLSSVKINQNKLPKSF
jgi:hypothetical protein